MKLRISGVNVATYNVGGDAGKEIFQEFTYKAKTKAISGKARVRFANDCYRRFSGEDRNLWADRIEIDGVIY